MPVDSVAMGGSLSAVLGLVAAAVPDGARVATLAGEFTSTTFPFAAQAGRGVTLAEMTAEELLSTAADYDVVVASLVQSANGDRLDVEALRAAVQGSGIVTIIDVTQAVGWKELDLGWVDVTAASVYKWLLALARNRVDVVERQDLSSNDPAPGQLVCGRGALVVHLRSTAAVG